MVNALGQVTTHGMTIRDLDKEGHESVISECRTRQATPEEQERYFGPKVKEKPKLKRAMSKSELQEKMAEHYGPTLEDLIEAARKVDEKRYKTMKAAVMVIGIANGWE